MNNLVEIINNQVVVNTKWTQKGRLKIHEILTAIGIMANMDKTSEVAKNDD